MKINEQKVMPALNQLFMTVHLLWNEQDPGVPLRPWFLAFNKCWLGTAMFLARFLHNINKERQSLNACLIAFARIQLLPIARLWQR